MDQSEKDSWEKAKRLLIGAVDTVLEKNNKPASKQIRPDDRSPGPSVSGTKECKKPSPYEEHRRLFGYQVSKEYSTRPAKRSYKPKGKKKAATWTKDVICLKYSDQDVSPTTEEKMELAALNLGPRKLVFGAESDASEVHGTILTEFPILNDCGGYTLMRVSENSRSLVAIEGPSGGVDVPFLRDILRQAKLYVRPLQCDVPEKHLKLLIKETKEVRLYYFSR
jgi:hypothetical protein